MVVRLILTSHREYFYHGDHLQSATLITDYEGSVYERINYTPYGELWLEKSDNNGENYLPYRFTGKELDSETGLYYYGARYLDPKYSRWLSTDPALGEYIPQAPISDEAKKHNQNLPRMGGVFNAVNLNLYHYAGNNPVKYTDPDGSQSIPFSFKDFLNLTNDPHVKLYNEMLAADNGDKNAQARLKYVFHEAGRETLKQTSSTLNDMALVSLCIGFPEGAGVFGTAANVCDFALLLDDAFVNKSSTLKKDALIFIAGVVYSEGTKFGGNALAKSINITIGKTGKYYELGHRGAIKSERALRKQVVKDVDSGYFGKEVIPNAKSIADEVVKIYKALKEQANE
ncbi:MAG: RHS repeat-associated core domain-containing protein [Alphaproteobacteria bacterium]|nr:RHS repeat-associated core domain-containing protein [Alphaproteobacteria bacterium]